MEGTEPRWDGAWSTTLPAGFEDYVEEANRATSIDELFDVLMKELRRHGFDRANFALLSRDTDIAAGPGVGIVHNYPADWMSYSVSFQVPANRRNRTRVAPAWASDVLEQTERIVDCRMRVARRHGISDPEQLKVAVGVAHHRLGNARGQLLIRHFTEIR